MKKLTTILFVFISTILAKAELKRDTTIVEFTDKGVKKRITLYTTGKRDFDIPKNINLDNVLRNIGVDSSERKRAIVLVGESGDKKDTILVVSREGKRIKIVAKDPTDTIIRADTTTRPSKREQDSWSRDERVDNNQSRSGDYDNNEPAKPKKEKFFSASDFGVYLGLNGWAKDPLNPSATLSTWQSRYVALSWRKNATLIRGKQVDMSFSYGPEIAWNNFMFEGQNAATYANNKVAIAPITTTKSLTKSKLVVPTVNFPIMLNFGFKEAKFVIGFGGYIGYRLGGYTKLKYEGGAKEKIKGNYGLEDFKYGLTTEIGRRNGLTFFFRYDMVPMFKASQTSVHDLQAWSVGIRL